MSHSSDQALRLSLRLSKVLDDIGVNDEIVRRRRQTVLAEESLQKMSNNLQGQKITTYKFGSRTEGTTTEGLQSDSDTLFTDNRINIIQARSEWNGDYKNFLMVRDSNTPPGYCLLHQTYDNDSRPVVHPETGRILLRNDFLKACIPEHACIHGPSVKFPGFPGFYDGDLVPAFYCKSWPSEAQQWLDGPSRGSWPSRELKRQAIYDGCFVVPVGCRGTENEKFQWRISTSLTERKIMFSLNIVQIRCYVLMKMILKTHEYLNSNVALSSFICKNVLLHCIEIEEESIWQDNNLLGCLNVCLKFLYDSVVLEHCPHFIIKENNLLAHRISPEIKPQILGTIQHFLLNDYRALMEIEIDQLGRRFSEQFQPVNSNVIVIIEVQSSFEMKQLILGHLLHSFMQAVSSCMGQFMSSLTKSSTDEIVQTLRLYIDRLSSMYLEGNFEQVLFELLSSFLYSSLGSVLASQSISKNIPVPHSTLALIENGSICFSSSLKHASVLYCTGNMLQTLNILDQVEEQYNLDTLQSVCCCYQSQERGGRKAEFDEVSAEGDIKHVLKHTAFCVRYLPSEVNCVPEELQHEYFRSELDTYQLREQKDYWMDWAVVDSIPFFYFLLYKVCSNQGMRERQQAACDKLRQAINTDRNLGHKETALNLLGQCLQQENRLGDALQCYNESMDLCPVHNAANSLTFF